VSLHEHVLEDPNATIALANEFTAVGFGKKQKSKGQQSKKAITAANASTLSTIESTPSSLSALNVQRSSSPSESIVASATGPASGPSISKSKISDQSSLSVPSAQFVQQKYEQQANLIVATSLGKFKICSPSKEDSALFVCDVQEGFKSASFTSFSDKLIATICKFTHVASMTKMPIVIGERKGMRSTVDAVKQLLPEASCLKSPPRSLFSMLNKDVLQYLASTNGRPNFPSVANVFIVGIELHVSIFQSCIDLMKNNYQPIVVLDGCASSSKLDFETCMDRLRQAGVIITTSSCAIHELLQSADSAILQQVLKM
jgi:isochorismate hydrolase